MKEANKVTGKATLEEQDKDDTLDDNTREVVDEYSRKFLVFIQQEKDRARKNALSESEKIVTDAEKKGQLVYEKTIHGANAEAESIIARAKEVAKQITTNTDKYLKVANEARVNAEKVIEDAKNELRRQSEIIVEYYRKQEKVLIDIEEKLGQELSSSSSMLVDLKQEIEQNTKTDRVIAPSQPEEPPVVPEKTKTNREEPVNRSQSSQEDPVKRQSEKTYVGTINIDVFRKNPVVSKRFRESLGKIPGFEISLVDDSAKDRAKIVAYANQPLPILNVLHQMSLVRSAIADEDTIKVVLQDSDAWVG